MGPDDVGGVEGPAEELPAGVLEEAKGFQFRKGLGNSNWHSWQQWEQAHHASRRLVVPLQPTFFSSLQLVVGDLWFHAEKGSVLSDGPEQDVLLFVGDPLGTEQGCNVLGGVQAVHERSLQKFGVMWFWAERRAAGNDAAASTFRLADAALHLLALVPVATMFLLLDFLLPGTAQGLTESVAALSAVGVRIP